MTFQGTKTSFSSGKGSNHLENPPTIHSSYEFLRQKLLTNHEKPQINHQSFTNRSANHHPGFLPTSASELNVFHNWELRSSQRRKRTVRLEPVRVRKASTVSPNLVESREGWWNSCNKYITLKEPSFASNLTCKSPDLVTKVLAKPLFPHKLESKFTSMVSKEN